MESEIICVHCLNSLLCKECSIFDAENGFLNLPKKSVSFHLNKNILYENKTENNVYKNKNVLLVGCGSIKRTSVLKSLKLLLFNRFVCLARHEQKWADVYFHDWILAEHEDISSKDNTLKAVNKYMELNQIKFDAILTYDDYCVLMTSFLTSNLNNLIGIPFEFIEKIKNKYEFRCLCSDLKINCPRFFLIKSSERKEFVSKIDTNQTDAKLFKTKDDNVCRLPLIVKNVSGSGKDFVKKCKTLKSLKDCIRDSLKASNPIDLLVEEYIGGIELDIDILIRHNAAEFVIISDNFPPLEPSFHEQGGVTPSIKLSNKEIELIETIISKWLSKMNFQNGLVHFEAKYDSSLFNDLNEETVESSLMPIEINPRLGGCETWSNVKASCGVDLIREHLNICLNIEAGIFFTGKKFRCISRNFLAKNKSFEAVKLNLDSLGLDNDCIELAIFKPVGEIVKLNENVGWISVRNDYELTETQLFAKLNNVLNNVKFKFAKNIFIEIEK